MSSTALLSLADDLAADRQISSDEALRLRKAIFPDGVVSRQEADVLLSLAERVSDADPAWSQAFVEAIVDHVLQAGVYPGHVDAESTAWLARSFAEADRTGVETLLKIAERAESAPDDLMAFMRARVFDLVAGQPMSADGVELVRRAAYASGGRPWTRSSLMSAVHIWDNSSVQAPDMAVLILIGQRGEAADVAKGHPGRTSIR